MTCEDRPEKTSALTCRPGPPRSHQGCQALHSRPRRPVLSNRTSLCTIAVHQARLAIARMWKSCASPDHLPPVSHARTTRRARPSSPANSGYLSSFRRRAWARAAPRPLWRTAASSPVSPTCAHEGRVHGKLGSVEERQTIRDDKEFKILDPDVGGHTGSSSSTDPRNAAPQREALVVPSTPVSRKLHCTVVATRVEWLATQAESGREGKRAPEAAQEEDPETLRIKTRSR